MEDLLSKTSKAISLREREIVAHTHAPIWCCAFAPPVPTSLPVQEQARRMVSMRMEWCNDATALAFGASSSEELIGRPYAEIGRADPDALFGLMCSFVNSGYRIVDAELPTLTAAGATE